MATKLIYFVRHGQTENNAQNIKQGSEGSLSAVGREQALAAAKRFPKEKGRPQFIISSPFERTKETAEIIAKELNMKVHYSDLLVERRKPSSVLGHWGGEPEVKRIMDHIDRSYHDDDMRVADEENFMDVKARAKKVLKFIAGRSEKRIIVVTHSNFLKVLVSYMLHGDSLTASEYSLLGFYNPINNSSMTICSYTHHWFKKDEWKIIVWNDLDERKNT